MIHTEADRKGLARRLDATAWGLLFIMIGGLLLLPSAVVPDGIWLVGAGLTMLSINVACQLNGISVSPFGVGLGVMAVLAGLAELAGPGLPVLPLIVIVIGAEIIFKAARSQDG